MKPLIILFLLISCSGAPVGSEASKPPKHHPIGTGAERVSVYLPLLNNKRVAIVANATSIIGGRHLVDSLKTCGVDIRKVFAPEHGFRGNYGAGEHVSNEKDPQTGLPVISLYGKNKKPSAESLKDVDIVIFDIQDVGARFYTYISTMHYVMEACAENGKHLIVLDRPNPNGFYIDGPVLDTNFRSFVGMHPIPVVHGCTTGELARMINGEKWLSGGIQCDLTVISCVHYTHSMRYALPVSPSPNLPDMTSVYAYPSLCFFEGTAVSVGRGTDFPFQCYGYPGYPETTFSFTPRDIPGKATDPPYENQACTGKNIDNQLFKDHSAPDFLQLEWLLDAYAHYPQPSEFFNSPGFFDKLAGTDLLRKAVLAGHSAEEIRAEWKTGLEGYRAIRSRYLLYEDFPVK